MITKDNHTIKPFNGPCILPLLLVHKERDIQIAGTSLYNQYTIFNVKALKRIRLIVGSKSKNIDLGTIRSQD